MLYVQQSLGPEEELVHVGNFHWIYTFSAAMSIVWGLALCIGIIAGSLAAQSFSGYSLGAEVAADDGVLTQIQKLHPGIRLTAFMALIFGVLRFSQMMVIKATTEIAVTTNRLIYKRGFVARSVGEISIDRIEGVNVYQGILGRLLNYGRVMVRGMGVGELVLPPIEDPINFRKAIEKARTL